MILKQEAVQKLTLSQNVLLSTRILQMSGLELHEYLESIAIENPLVDIDSLTEFGNNIKYRISSKNKFERYNSYIRNSDNSDEPDSTLWNFDSKRGVSLSEHLISQLGTLKLTNKERRICTFIAYSINRRGFLSETPASISHLLSCDEKEAKALLSMMKQLDPIGVCTANVAECLEIQSKALGGDNLTNAIVSTCLELLSKKNYRAIAKKLSCSVSDIYERMAFIEKLEPYPGRGFGQGEIEYIYPDVLVKSTDLGLDVELLTADTSYFPISDYYRTLIDSGCDADTKTYINEKLRQAKWVSDCIVQRSNTLRKVTLSIIKHQHDFFSSGPKALRPLNMREIATDTGMHESTVSRTVREKYLLCDFGLFELIDFFPSGLRTSEGEDLTSSSVKKKISDIIDSESKSKPMSDRLICESLNNEGIDVSRRTVTKYREQLSIPSAHLRRIP